MSGRGGQSPPGTSFSKNSVIDENASFTWIKTHFWPYGSSRGRIGTSLSTSRVTFEGCLRALIPFCLLGSYPYFGHGFRGIFQENVHALHIPLHCCMCVESFRFYGLYMCALAFFEVCCITPHVLSLSMSSYKNLQIWAGVFLLHDRRRLPKSVFLDVG